MTVQNTIHISAASDGVFMQISRRTHILGLVTLLLVMGCQAEKPKGTESTPDIKKIGIVYLRYVGSHRGQAPADRQELEKFLAEIPPDGLKAMGIADRVEVFRSSRDGEEFVIRYGITVPPPGPGNPTVVIYEKTGVGGKHMVVYGTAGTDEVDDKRLKELVPEFK